MEQLLAALHALSKEMKASGVGWPDSLMVHLYLKDMSHFAAVNAAYIRVVPATAPPARACVEACLPEGVLVSVDVLARAPGQSASKRGCLHVQSVSSWAPACIGPYAQGTRAMGLVHLAGQIGLDPPTMQLREGPHQAAQAAANASAVAACLKAPLETCALYCTIYALDQGELVAGAAAWNFLLDAPPQPAGARSDDPDADPEGGPAWRQKWRPPVTYVVVPHLPRGACVEVRARPGGAGSCLSSWPPCALSNCRRSHMTHFACASRTEVDSQPAQKCQAQTPRLLSQITFSCSGGAGGALCQGRRVGGGHGRVVHGQNHGGHAAI